MPVPAEGFDGGLAYEGWAVELGLREMVSSGETHSSLRAMWQRSKASESTLGGFTHFGPTCQHRLRIMPGGSLLFSDKLKQQTIGL